MENLLNLIESFCKGIIKTLQDPKGKAAAIAMADTLNPIWNSYIKTLKEVNKVDLEKIFKDFSQGIPISAKIEFMASMNSGKKLFAELEKNSF